MSSAETVGLPSNAALFTMGPRLWTGPYAHRARDALSFDSRPGAQNARFTAHRPADILPSALALIRGTRLGIYEIAAQSTGSRMTKAVVGLMLVLMCVCGLTTFAQTPKTIALADATIADLNAAFDAGTLTSEQLVQMCLARIRAYDRQGRPFAPS